MGWHLCENKCLEDRTSLARLSSYRWAPNSLYHRGGQDVDICIWQMMDRAAPQTQILDCLEDLHRNSHISTEKFRKMTSWVLANTDASFLDVGVVNVQASRTPLGGRSEEGPARMDADKLAADVTAAEERMAQLWDFDVGRYRRYSEFDPKRRMPSQLLAFQQLKFRLSSNVPLLVAIVAPAGFGKSELLSAWLSWLKMRRYLWAVCGITGVAASQLEGSTVHNLMLLRADGTSGLPSHPQKQDELMRTQGLLIDEALMGSELLFSQVADLLREYPLQEQLRRPGAVSKFGYRDIIIGGDVRQLPPASTECPMPYWASTSFYEDFEMMVLTEDRRHERDLPMQQVKELLAWGGVESLDNLDTEAPAWPVHPLVMSYVTNGYLRGWGLSGDTVNLEVGTAIFGRRADVNRWNDACRSQIETKFGEECEAVDIHGLFLSSDAQRQHFTPPCFQGNGGMCM